MTDLARELKASFRDVAALCHALNIKVRRSGSSFFGSCVWHVEKSASMHLWIDKRGAVAAFCHGCQRGGSALDLVGAVFGLDPRRDFRDLARVTTGLSNRWDLLAELGGGQPRERPPASPPPPPEPPPVYCDSIHRRMLELCQVGASAEACAYLENRGIFAEAQAFGLGALPHPRAQAAIVRTLRDEFGDELLRASGQWTGGESFWCSEHALLIPWRDERGRVYAVQRRLLRREGTAEKSYLFAPGRPMPGFPFGARVFADALAFHRLGGFEPQVAFVEGPLDALSMRTWNRKTDRLAIIVLGVPSASARIDVEVWGQFVRGFDVVLAFDVDGAGDKAAERFASQLCAGRAKSITRARPLNAKDSGEILVRGTK